MSNINLKQKQNLKILYQQIDLNKKLLLLCDFTGKIVFWKGDPKVLETPSPQYLHKNILSFDFTLYTRLIINTKLTYDLYKEDQIQSFQLELIKNKNIKSKKSSNRNDNLYLPMLRYNLFNEIKLLKVSVSCIEAVFGKTNKLVENKCKINYFSKNKKTIIHENFHNIEKLLMFEIEDNVDTIKPNHMFWKFSRTEILQRFLDIECMKKVGTSIYMSNSKRSQGAFTMYCQDSKNEDMHKQKNEYEEMEDCLNEYGYPISGYFTRSKKKLKKVEDYKEENKYMIDQNDMFKIFGQI